LELSSVSRGVFVSRALCSHTAALRCFVVRHLCHARQQHFMCEYQQGFSFSAFFDKRRSHHHPRRQLSTSPRSSPLQRLHPVNSQRASHLDIQDVAHAHAAYSVVHPSKVNGSVRLVRRLVAFAPCVLHFRRARVFLKGTSPPSEDLLSRMNRIRRWKISIQQPREGGRCRNSSTISIP